MQNLKSLLLSGCERKQKHQMAAEKTRDKESGWEVCSDTKPSSAELCQGSCSCLEPTLQSGDGKWALLSWIPAGGAPRAHRQCLKGCTTQVQQILYTVLSHLPALHIPQNPVRSPLLAPLCQSGLRTRRGQSPAQSKWGVVSPESVLRWERCWSSSEWLDVIFLELGACTGHGTGVGAGLKRVHSIWLPHHGMGQQIPYF